MKINDISVIILLYKTPNNVLKNLLNYKKFNILILDQSNDINIKKKILRIFPKIKYYHITDKNKGFAAGINHLVKKVKTKYFLCTQPDTIISYKSILQLKKAFLLKKNCIISVPKIKKNSNFKIKKVEKNIIMTENIIGAIFLADKKKFMELKMFDENFFFYWEDVDLSKRIVKSKYDMYINLNSEALHLSGKSTVSTMKSLFIKKSNFKFGEYLYQFKNNKLKLIKIFREPLTYILSSFYFLLTFRPIMFLEKLFSFLGIINFLIFVIKKALIKKNSI